MKHVHWPQVVSAAGKHGGLRPRFCACKTRGEVVAVADDKLLWAGICAARHTYQVLVNAACIGLLHGLHVMVAGGCCVLQALFGAAARCWCWCTLGLRRPQLCHAAVCQGVF